MVILSFGSGLDMENEDPANLARFRELAGLRPRPGHRDRRVFAPRQPQRQRSGRRHQSPHRKDGRRGLRRFALPGEPLGPGLFPEDQGLPRSDRLRPPGARRLVSRRRLRLANHPGHRGLDDSQWTQWRTITDFYKWCRGRGIYLNVPDWYFLSGSNKTGMGYRETNWSLPRDRQIILGRQNIFDGTWEKTPSMGWMFVPLVEYQGGGAAATLEPLAEHLDAYEAHLAQNFLSGVQACYRGPRLYDTEETRQRGQEVGGFLQEAPRHPGLRHHSCPAARRPRYRRYAPRQSRGNPRGLAVFHNPTGQAIEKIGGGALVLYRPGSASPVSGKEDGPAVDYKSIGIIRSN